MKAPFVNGRNQLVDNPSIYNALLLMPKISPKLQAMIEEARSAL